MEPSNSRGNADEAVPTDAWRRPFVRQGCGSRRQHSARSGSESAAGPEGRQDGRQGAVHLAAGAAYALGELHGIASGVAAMKTMGDLLELQRVEEYYEDADPD
jgi:hypothetical protein